MGKKFNTLLFIIMALLFIAIIVVKFVYKRPLSVSNTHKSLRPTMAISKINYKKNNHIFPATKMSSKHMKQKISLYKSLKPDINFNGKKYKLSGIVKNDGLEIININNGSRAVLTNKLLIKPMEHYNKGDFFNKLLKKYQLSMVKNISHLGLYYVRANSASLVTKIVKEMSKEKSIESIDYEILNRPAKVK